MADELKDHPDIVMYDPDGTERRYKCGCLKCAEKRGEEIDVYSSYPAPTGKVEFKFGRKVEREDIVKVVWKEEDKSE